MKTTRLKLSTKTKAIMVWAALGFAIASQYNACSPTSFQSDTYASETKEALQSASSILINGGAAYTKDQLVELTLESKQADEMYITNDPTCASGGRWEALNNKKLWTLNDVNKQQMVYAKYRDVNEGVETSCILDSIIHDSEKPVIVLEKNPLMTNAMTPIFKFVASDAVSGVKTTYCKWPGKVAVECDSASSDGNLAEGQYVVQLNAEDKAGNIGDIHTQTISVDRTPPVVTLAGPPSISSITTPTFTFSATDAGVGVDRLECSKENTTSFSTCVSPLNWTIAEGSHHFYVRAIDKAGNVSNPVDHPFLVDLSAPTVFIRSGPPVYHNSRIATFTFDGVDGVVPLTDFECRVDTGTFAPCTSPKTFTLSSDGPQKFEVRGIDAVGNRSAAAAHPWTIDTVKPIVAFVGPTPKLITNQTTATFNYSSSDVATGVAATLCSYNGATFVACNSVTYSSFPLLTERVHTFQVKVRDFAGNEGETPLFSWRVDLTPPVLNVTVFPSGIVGASGVAQFSFVATDNLTASPGVQCKLDVSTTYPDCNSKTSHQVTVAEGAHQMALRAVDEAGNYSLEAVKQWTADLSGPIITFSPVPTPTIPITATQTFAFQVMDPIAGVQSTTCKLDNNASVACTPGTVTYSGLAYGKHIFEVTAIDKVGNSSKSTAEWTVQMPVLTTQTAEVKNNNKIDVVVIMDNSGSMQSEMRNMAANFGNFLTQLKDFDWQLGIITTDPTVSDSPMMDGRLVELESDSFGTKTGQFIIKSSMEPAVAQNLFAKTIEMPIALSGLERGILTAKRSVQRAFDGKVINAGSNKLMFRDDAVLAFLVVTDSYDGIDSTGFVTQPSDLINEVTARWGGKKVFSYHSLVVPESPYTNSAGTANSADPCANYRESWKRDGRIYEQLSTLTGGIKGTMCTTDYAAQLTTMGEATMHLIKSVTLKCVPYDQNQNMNVNDDIEVRDASGNVIPIAEYAVNGDKLQFTNNLPIGINTIKYYCP